MDEFFEIARSPLTYLKQTVDSDNLAISFSGVFPLELLDAMGFRAVWLPPVMRVRYTRADSLLQVFMCSRSRSVVDVLAGQDLPIAAVGAVTDCDAKDVIPGVLEAAGVRVPVVTLRVPIRVDHSAAVDLSIAAVKQWVQEARQAFGRDLDPGLLARSCALRARVRQRITEVFEGIGRDVDPVFAYAVAISSQVMPPDKFLRLLGAGPWPKPSRGGVPTLLTGSELPNLAMVEDLQDLGALIVADDTETGVRAASRPAEHPHCDDWETRSSFDTEGILEVIGAGMVFRKHGPTKVTAPGSRLQELVGLCMHRGVKAAVFGLFKFCDPHAFEAPELIEQMKMAGVRSLIIEVDKEKGLLARERTRVQTLMESVE